MILGFTLAQYDFDSAIITIMFAICYHCYYCSYCYYD